MRKSVIKLLVGVLVIGAAIWKLHASETLTATNIVATSTLSSPTHVITGGTNPTIVVCNSSPPTSLDNAGSLCLDTTAFRLYQTSGGGSWTQVGGGVGSSFWTSVFAGSLQSGSLAGFTARTGAWAAVAGTGFQIDDDSAEAYLSYESGGTIAAPFAENGSYAMQVEFTYTASSTASTDVGIVLYGDAAVIGSGALRVFLRRDGSAVGCDVFGGGGGCSTIAYPGGATAPGTFHTLNATLVGGVTAAGTNRAQYMTIYIDGVAVYQTTFNGGTFYASPRVGLWSNRGHAQFHNLKIWQVAPAS